MNITRGWYMETYLHPDADWAVTHVGVPRFLDGIIVDFDHPVQVSCHHLGDVLQLLEVVGRVALGDFTPHASVG